MANRLAYEFRNLTFSYREGSYQTQKQRRLMLELIANELRAIGFKHLSLENIKQWHIRRLVAEWQKNGTGCGTVKNRLSALRWGLRKAGRANAYSG